MSLLQEQIVRWLVLEGEYKVLDKEVIDTLTRRPEFGRLQFLNDPEYEKYWAIVGLRLAKGREQDKIAQSVGVQLKDKFLILPDGNILTSFINFGDGDGDGGWTLEIKKPFKE